MNRQGILQGHVRPFKGDVAAPGLAVGRRPMGRFAHHGVMESGDGQNLVPERAVVTDRASRCYGLCATPDWTIGLLSLPAPTQLGGAGGAAW